MASTAAFDKNPQSQERGITLDLGFSAFYSDSQLPNYDKIQFTLVDCPGHASLIRTIIGGAQIIDFMVLVIDAIKGVQTQTAEVCVWNRGYFLFLMNFINYNYRKIKIVHSDW